MDPSFLASTRSGRCSTIRANFSSDDRERFVGEPRISINPEPATRNAWSIRKKLRDTAAKLAEVQAELAKVHDANGH